MKDYEHLNPNDRLGFAIMVSDLTSISLVPEEDGESGNSGELRTAPSMGER